ncbi:MAG: hypothetical protein JWR33_2466 [Naasia sp.]|jgi:hypothetical protein|uniref:hypothetical protein n=1 Tax=Naasia sp. TaxID=2546198 RepID=UPI0026149345|nr:hypothetical protein [Naasia sp.]MCU1571725.1 hypothetical protein [Naasia sp.]
MTLWQEQPRQERQGTASSSNTTAPRSRREARDAERRGDTGDLSGVHPSDVYDLNSSGNIWDTLSRRAASQLTDAASEAERRTGRRVSDTDHPSEPLSYITQGRPQMPTYDATRRPSQPSSSEPDQGFRSRSFAPAEDTRTRPVTRTGTPLEYATVGRPAPGLLAEAQAAAAAPAPEHTMSRRELRAIRETGQAPTLSQTDSGAWLPTWEPQSLPQAGSAFTQAPAAPRAFGGYNDTATVEMSAIDRASIAAEQPVSLISDEQILEALSPAAPTGPVPQAAPFSDRTIPRAPRGSWPPAPPLAPAAAAQADETLDGLSGFEAMIAQARSGLTGEVPDSALQPQRQQARVERPFTPPRGHWSAQAEADDDALPFEGMLTRNVGSSTGSTNALIMSNDPQPDLLSAVNATGEIYITGSLDLPRSLSSTGAPSDNYDSSEIDRLFEASQDDSQTGDVAPVRAARAVATHTSTRSVVSPRKRRGGLLPTVLAVTAALMAIGVIALLIGGYVLRLF